MEAKFVKQITVFDPDTEADVQLFIYKHQNGGMFAMDSSYIEQVVDDSECIPDPFSDVDNPSKLYLIELI